MVEDADSKRVNYSSRTVIGADPTLKLNQLGIPHEVAQILTKPEMVTCFNIKKLTDIVNDGKANFIRKIGRKNDEDGNEIGPEILKSKQNLQYAMFRKGTELLYNDIIVRGDIELKTDKNGKVILPKKDLKNPNLIFVKTGKEVLKEGDKLIRDGKFIQVSYPTKKKIDLKIGDIVDRHLTQGDAVLLNRQPKIENLLFIDLKVCNF